jgi:hypothetical protein
LLAPLDEQPVYQGDGWKNSSRPDDRTSYALFDPESSDNGTKDVVDVADDAVIVLQGCAVDGVSLCIDCRIYAEFLLDLWGLCFRSFRVSIALLCRVIHHDFRADTYLK